MIGFERFQAIVQETQTESLSEWSTAILHRVMFHTAGTPARRRHPFDGPFQSSIIRLSFRFRQTTTCVASSTGASPLRPALQRQDTKLDFRDEIVDLNFYKADSTTNVMSSCWAALPLNDRPRPGAAA